ncbi:MAG TPA: hypothetical protein VFE15_15040 [Marmoricola sp.]|jgi:hypothetical protein|nr:hypothetical protein [Marmoricola sp.]
MRSKLLSLLTVIGAVTVLVLASNTVALAATGHSFLLGKTNKANKTTTLSRTTAGAALTVKTKSSTNPPFVVNGTGKVTHLNADSLDGKDSTAFASVGALPVAYGYIEGGAGGINPSIASGSKGVSAVSWDAADSRYVIALTGQNYIYDHYATVVTGTCGNQTANGSSVDGDLLVAFTSPQTCAAGFAFITYKIR